MNNAIFLFKFILETHLRKEMLLAEILFLTSRSISSIIRSPLTLTPRIRWLIDWLIACSAHNLVILAWLEDRVLISKMLLKLAQEAILIRTSEVLERCLLLLLLMRVRWISALIALVLTLSLGLNQCAHHVEKERFHLLIASLDCYKNFVHQ